MRLTHLIYFFFYSDNKKVNKNTLIDKILRYFINKHNLEWTGLRVRSIRIIHKNFSNHVIVCKFKTNNYRIHAFFSSSCSKNVSLTFKWYEIKCWAKIARIKNFIFLYVCENMKKQIKTRLHNTYKIILCIRLLDTMKKGEYLK